FSYSSYHFFFFQAEDGIRGRNVTGVQTCALPISYFILHNLEVQTPEPIPANIRKKSSKRKSQSISKKHNSKNNVFTNEKRYNIRSQKNKKNAHLKSVSKKNTKHRHFTIRQK